MVSSQQSLSSKPLQLVLNAGSSSFKYALYRITTERCSPVWKCVAQGLAEGIGSSSQCRIKHEADGVKTTHRMELPDHRAALLACLDLLPEEWRSSIGSIGHRIVHGGEGFKSAALINDTVLKGIQEAAVLAPLHNPWNLLGVEVAAELFGKDCPQVAVFDTAFHQTMKPSAFMYALPQELYEKHHIRRYGFHGTSYQYLTEETARALGKPSDTLNIIACHIGNGASMCAIEGGKCIDTTMGLTPLEGLVMGTRCGDIDPAIPTHLMSNHGYSASDVDNMLNKKSGLLGLCGTFDDREVEGRYFDNEPAGTLAKDVQVHQIRKYLGAYMVALRGDVDAVVFSAGLGEKSHLLRGLVCQGLEKLGLELDDVANRAESGRFSENTCISTSRSRIPIWVIPVDEELCIAQQTFALVSNQATSPQALPCLLGTSECSETIDKALMAHREDSSLLPPSRRC